MFIFSYFSIGGQEIKETEPLRYISRYIQYGTVRYGMVRYGTVPLPYITVQLGYGTLQLSYFTFMLRYSFSAVMLRF